MNGRIALLSLCFWLAPAASHEVPLEGIVNLYAFASVEVNTDTMQATVSVEAENHDPAVLARNINKKMAWALKTAEPFKSIKVKGGQYTSHQLFDKRIFKAWRGRQVITLESKSPEKLGELIGLLQKKLLVKSIRYSVSKAKVTSVTELLTKQAITNFKQQAQLISDAFDNKTYVIHQININSNNQHRPVHYSQTRMMSADPMTRKASPVNLQKSTSNIRVNVNGSIRLIK